jgi:D-3-phosphoglycerate dehydrogenase / 2-oxoglutarate reductase
VLAVPHLGASTEEAQEQVSLEAAEQLVEALRGGQIRNAVNAPGFDQALPAMLRPYIQLAMHMGILLSKITPGAPEKVQITYRGGLADLNVAPVTTYLLMGLMSPYMAQPVNLINAPVLAQQRGLEVGQSATKDVKGFASVMEVTLKTDQTERNLVGTIFGNSQPRIIGIDGYRVEMKPEGHVLIIFNDDMPGVVGTFGTILGRNKINIADMTLSRREDPKKAVIGINLDNAPSEAVIAEIRSQKFVNQAYYLELPSLNSEEQGD